MTAQCAVLGLAHTAVRPAVCSHCLLSCPTVVWVEKGVVVRHAIKSWAVVGLPGAQGQRPVPLPLASTVGRVKAPCVDTERQGAHTQTHMHMQQIAAEVFAVRLAGARD